MEEHLVCNQEVVSSTLTSSTKIKGWLWEIVKVYKLSYEGLIIKYPCKSLLNNLWSSNLHHSFIKDFNNKRRNKDES